MKPKTTNNAGGAMAPTGFDSQPRRSSQTTNPKRRKAYQEYLKALANLKLKPKAKP